MEKHLIYRDCPYVRRIEETGVNLYRMRVDENLDVTEYLVTNPEEEASVLRDGVAVGKQQAIQQCLVAGSTLARWSKETRPDIEPTAGGGG